MADMAKGLDLDQKHSDYLATKAVREKSRDLYEGDEIVKAKNSGQTYLFKGQNESDDGYTLRLNRAVYENWAKSFVEARQALTWRKMPDRDNLPEELKIYLSDCDGAGSSANEFFQDADEDANVDGLHFVLVDKTPLPVLAETSTAPLSKRQEEEMGVRPFFRRIMAGDMYDWSFGEDNKLNWCVIAQKAVTKPGPGQETTEIEQRLIWYRDRWELWRAAGTNEEGTWVIESTGPNPIGEVPVVAFYGNKKDTFRGRPVIADVVGHLISIYNKFSDRDWAEWLTCNPLLLIISEEKPFGLATGSSMGQWLKPGTMGQPSMGYVEPTGSGITLARDSELDLIRRAHQIMQRQAKKDTAQVQAADSLKEETRLFTSSLTAHSDELQKNEAQCWRYMYLWQHPGDKTDFSEMITYRKDFDDKAIEASMIASYSNMVAQGQLSKETFLKMLRDGEILPDEIDLDEELLRIEADQEKIALPGFLSGAPAAEGEEPAAGDTDGAANG